MSDLVTVQDPAPPLADLTPRQIVAELDKYIVGQAKAKRAVAIALRNRWRRQQLDPELADEIHPKNILMLGSTGLGKTEIARRLAKLARAPFLKVEASKFTEVGYVGRDVESIIRDLTETAIGLVKVERRESVRASAAEAAEEALLDILLPKPAGFDAAVEEEESSTRSKMRQKLRDGDLDEREVEVEIEETGSPSLEMITNQGVEEVGFNLKDMIPGIFGGQKKKRQKVKVSEARELLAQQEAEKMIDRQQLSRDARDRVEQSGIIFLDEIDKIATREEGRGPDVSREGVQRDLLPIVEGSTVSTKYGSVKTDHILFIAAGAFHVSKPSDLIPELQGRLPIRVELDSLTESDFVRILTEPENALTRQYSALLSTEGLIVSFTEDAVAEIARLAVQVNQKTENIGARRLATLMERLLEEVSFEAPQMSGVTLAVDASYVKAALAEIVDDQDMSRYVL